MQTRAGSRALGVGVSGLVLMLAPALVRAAWPAQANAEAPPPATWTGGSGTSPDWSVASDWEGKIAPKVATGVGTLTFPRLTSAACTAEPPTHACYDSFNDLSGLTAGRSR